MEAGRPAARRRKLIVVSSCHICGAPIYGDDDVSDAESIITRRTCTCADWTGVNKPYEPDKDNVPEAMGSVAEIIYRLTPAERNKLFKMGDKLVDRLREIYDGPSETS